MSLQTYIHTDETSDILPVYGPSMAFQFLPLLDIRSDVARVASSVSHIEQLESGMLNPVHVPDLPDSFGLARQPTFHSLRVNFSSVWNRMTLSSESFRSATVAFIAGVLTTWGFAAATLKVTNQAYEGDIWARKFEYYQYCKNLDEGQMTPECKEQLKAPFLPPPYRLKTRAVYSEIKTKCPLCESEFYNDSHHTMLHTNEHTSQAEVANLETITFIVVLFLLLVALCRGRNFRRGFVPSYPYGGPVFEPDDAYPDASEIHDDSSYSWGLPRATDTEPAPRPKRQRRLTSCKSSSALAPPTATARHVRGRRNAVPDANSLNLTLYNEIRYNHATDSSISALIEQGADVNCQLPEEYCTPLQAAAATGNLPVVVSLLRHGTDVNAGGGVYGSALQGAAQEDSHLIVQLLLQHGANPNAVGGKYGTALQAAAREGNEKNIMLLLQWGAEVNAEGGPCGSALQAAAMRDRKTVVRRLLEAGADVNIRGGPYGSALAAARAGEHDIIAELLLNAGALDEGMEGEL